MNIAFLVVGQENEGSIFEFFDMDSNPFKVGDELNLYKQFQDSNNLNGKRIKIVKESKFVVIVENQGSLQIEYFCEFVELE